MSVPRVAYFPDSFHEVNGVAHTSRNFVAYAERHGLPFLCVRASAGGDSARQVAARVGNVRTLDLRRSAIAVRMEKDLQFDPLFWRYREDISRQLLEFKPDVFHITGPSELGIFGAYLAWKHGVPLAASWHTNLHEYSARRLAFLTRSMPESAGTQLEDRVEDWALQVLLRFYQLASVLYAPNEELRAMLEARTGKPCHLMRRGVDTALFTPRRRRRPENDGRFVLGYVGRLSIEKNVALLVRLERELRALGIEGVEFSIIGHGDEEKMLRRELRSAHFAGILRGEALAAGYADMDLLVFPSHTDTFGNVVLEALASGITVVASGWRAKFIVRDGETGFAVPESGFAGTMAQLIGDRARLAKMRTAARAYAMGCSWDAVFNGVYSGYGRAQSKMLADASQGPKISGTPALR